MPKFKDYIKEKTRKTIRCPDCKEPALRNPHRDFTLRSKQQTAWYCDKCDKTFFTK